MEEVKLVAGLQVGEYLLETRLGAGGMGEVWRARQPMIDTTVAIKILTFEASSRRSQLERFLREARAVNRVQHRNLVKIFSFGELSDGRPYFVMEFLAGDNLRDYLKKTGPLPFATTLHITEQVARTLAAAHEQGVIHRDLKPENIFLVTEPNTLPFVKVLDFGVAKLTDRDPSERREHPTQTGATLGTPGYMAPEQYENSKTVDQRADIYSLGVILFEMITGLHPFEMPGETAYVVVARQLTTEPPAPSVKCKGRIIPKEIDAFLLRVLSKRAEDRPKGGQEFLEEFLKALGDYKNEKELNGFNPNEPTQVGASYAALKAKKQSAPTPTAPVKLDEVLFSDEKRAPQKNESTQPSIIVDTAVATQITPAPKANPLKTKPKELPEEDQDTAAGFATPPSFPKHPEEASTQKMQSTDEDSDDSMIDSPTQQPPEETIPESEEELSASRDALTMKKRVIDPEVASAKTAAYQVVPVNTPQPISLPSTSPRLKPKQLGFLVGVGVASLAMVLLLYLLLLPEKTTPAPPTTLQSTAAQPTPKKNTPPTPEPNKPLPKSEPLSMATAPTPGPAPKQPPKPEPEKPEKPKPEGDPCKEEKESAKQFNISKDWELALQVLSDAQSKCPNDPEVQRLFGYTYQQKGAINFACVRYANAIKYGLKDSLAKKTKETMAEIGCKGQ